MKRILLAVGVVIGLLAASRLWAPPPPAPSLPEQVQQLVRQLDDPSFEVRQQADEQLRRLGIAAVAPLQRELNKNPPLEVARRLQGILRHLGKLAWHKEQDAAFVEARRSGKPVLLFSTIGEVNGFS
jgi:hypothetical protein